MSDTAIPKCSSCPIAGEGPCSGVHAGHRGYALPRLCQLAGAGVRHHAAIRRDAAANHGERPPRGNATVSGHLTIDPHTFITTAQLTTDTEEFRKSLPLDIDFVIGISRSGMLPASILAYHLHLPLWGVSRHAGVANMGHGLRLESRGWIEPRHILLIDDTVASGTEMTACYPIVRERFPDAKITRAVIYARPSAVHAVDMFYATYDGYHYLQWNFANAGFGSLGAWDMDGLINRDFKVEECRDMDVYRSAMETITPLYLPRRLPIPMIVTARPESTRDITLRWLARHGVRVERLVMWPGDPHPPSSEVAPWKAKHYAESNCMTFIESDPGQAQAIAEITGRPVLCPAAGRLFPGKVIEPPKSSSSPHPNIREQLEIVHECDYRGHILIPRCGCQGEWRACGMGKGDAENPGQVRLSHCLECVKAR